MPAERQPLPRRNAATRESRDYPGHIGTPGVFGSAEHVQDRADSPVHHRAAMIKEAGGRHAGALHQGEQLFLGLTGRQHRLAEITGPRRPGAHSSERPPVTAVKQRGEYRQARDLRRHLQPDGDELLSVEASFARKADQLGALADRLRTINTPTQTVNDTPRSDAKIIADLENSLTRGEEPAGHHERTQVTKDERQILAATEASLAQGESARDPHDKSIKARLTRAINVFRRRGNGRHTAK